MPRVRLSKNELKKQKESLKRFRQYLPMLVLKKKQLQLETIKIYQAISALAEEIDNLRADVLGWVDVFAEEVSLSEFISLGSIKTDVANVAGIDTPLFLDVEFNQKPYDLLLTPLWVDKAIEVIKQMLTLKARQMIYYRQRDILREELRIVTQRVNLFEKVRIPQATEDIRIIQIYLGELQTAEVVRGKIAKAKIERTREAAYV
ncbi:MAG: V-type ATP synthase subunit D [Candidatus Omnitrophota bacterium]